MRTKSSKGPRPRMIVSATAKPEIAQSLHVSPNGMTPAEIGGLERVSVKT